MTDEQQQRELDIARHFGRRWSLLIAATCVVVALALCFAGLLPLFHSIPLEDKAAVSTSSFTHSAAFNAHALKLSALPENKQPLRTGFHFQPRQNWMNDPNGPMYYKGYYHLFYQYNPYAAVWGNITWGHALSRDLVHWRYLDDQTIRGSEAYDILGAWSGSATFLKDGTPVMLYTGWSNQSTQFQIQTQNLVYPANKSDPLLRQWIKAPQNPVIVASDAMNGSNFRDPTTGWLGPDGLWRILIGSRNGTSGTAFLYKSKDFVNWTYSHELHTVPSTGMWECPDFFPVSRFGKKGLDTSVNNGGVKHVLKVSLDNTRHDHYTVGTYDAKKDTFEPTIPVIDAGIGFRYDYGKFYASKTFYDYKKGRRILLGWVNESDSMQDDIAKGWSSVQAIPRTLWLDKKTEVDLIQLPVEEVKSLRGHRVSKENVELKAGSILPVDGADGAQLDVEVKFELPDKTQPREFNGTESSHLGAQSVCSQHGAARRGVFGPFGLLVLASKDLEEQTAIFFYLTPSSQEDGWTTIVCSDQSRSSLASDLDETIYGSLVRVSKSDKYLALRVLVDHSIIESFAQGGKTVITSRVYPTLAVGNAARLYLFNNGTYNIKVPSLRAYEMVGIGLRQF